MNMICLALALLLVSLPALAQSMAPRPPVGPEVVFTRTVGPWESEGRSGFARIVLARTGAREDTARLHVQWIAVDPRTGRFQIIASEEVQEIFDWRLRLDDYRVERQDLSAVVLLEATILTSGQQGRYELIIRNPGDVQFQRLSSAVR